MLRLRLHSLQTGLLALATAAVPSEAAPDVSIDDFRWKKRVLLIAIPAIDDGRRGRQEQELAPLKDSLTAWGIEVVVAPPGHPARARLPVAEHDFVIALIGIDGGIKLTRRELLTAADLRRELESPALRRSELKAAERARQKREPGAPDPAAELRSRLRLETPATGGGWTSEDRVTGEFSSRCWLFDHVQQAGPLRVFHHPAAVWHLQGDAVEALVLTARGEVRKTTIGSGRESGESAFLHLEAGDMLTVRLHGGGITGWSLLCETSAGSEPATADSDVLVTRFPEHAAWLRQLTSGKFR